MITVRGDPTADRSAVRTDIQALRAIAVVTVVGYHLWPHRLTGGYVGVDVFFVISGFLITSHLLNRPPTGWRPLLTFWGRRARRLLPASATVLLAVVVAVRLFAADTTWSSTAEQVRSAALYVVNWRLASSSVDYLAADTGASPVQHFWSLSVEEQFYLGWPLLILLLLGIARLLRRRLEPIVLTGLALVMIASLAYSVHETARDPGRAYFVTTTRIWELAAGGVLAAALWLRAAQDRHPPARRRARASVRGRVLLCWIGLAGIVCATIRFSGATPFPGWHAAIPVAGAVLVILAELPRDSGLTGRALALPPLQFLGDISYSVYLWHWPLIVIVPYVSGGNLGALDKAAILAATLALSVLTKVLIEDRFRRPSWARPIGKPFALAAVLMSVVIAAASLQVAESSQRAARSRAEFAKRLADDTPCFGAAAMAPGSHCKQTRTGSLFPSPADVAVEQSTAWRPYGDLPDCFAHPPRFESVTCTYGDRDSQTHVEVIGNSHVAQWLPALQDIAKDRGWLLTTDLATGCSLSFTLEDLVRQGMQPGSDHGCLEWSHRTAEKTAGGDADLVIMGNRSWGIAKGTTTAKSSQAAYKAGYEGVVRTLDRAGKRVVVIRDTPYPNRSIPKCLAENTENYRVCGGNPKSWLPADQLVAAVKEVASWRFSVIDMTSWLCTVTFCPAAVGSVPVYFDFSHISQAYVRTLEHVLAARLPRRP